MHWMDTSSTHLYLLAAIGLVLLVGSIFSIILLIILQLRFPATGKNLTRTLVQRSWSGRQVGLLLAGFVGLVLLLSLLHLLIDDSGSPAARLIPTLIFAASQVAILLWIGKWRKRDWTADFGMRLDKLKLLPLSLAIYLAAIPIVIFVGIAYRVVLMKFGVELHKQEVMQLIAHSHSWVRIGFVVLAVFVAPVYEELIFRGVFLTYLTRRIGLLPGILCVSIIFALLHRSIPAFLPLFTLSIILCLAYWRTGSLWTNIGIHAVFNTVTTAVLILTS